jgi:hypothetical protein
MLMLLLRHQPPLVLMMLTLGKMILPKETGHPPVLGLMLSMMVMKLVSDMPLEIRIGSPLHSN